MKVMRAAFLREGTGAKRRPRARAFLPLMIFLNACVPATQSEAPTRAALPVSIADSTLPPMKTFTARAMPAEVRSNKALAQDFLDLSFQMESGRSLPVLTRFETPITVAVRGPAPATLAPDLRRLLARLRREAGIDISQVYDPSANVIVQAVTRAEIRDVLPDAACFVAPNVSSLAEYRKLRRSARTDWTRLQTRERLTVFLPNDSSPQEVRDCLHEELAQSLGPLNDLYRLSDSVFNDDNVHTVLTGFDMLILRAYYDPALRSGMSRTQVARALPAILSRLNPAGDSGPEQRASFTPRGYSDAIQTALGRSTDPADRRIAASEAVRIADRMGWQDHRRAFAHFALGRVLQLSDPVAAQAHFQLADRLYTATPGTALHRAYVATQLAAYAISTGDGDMALRLLSPHLDTAQRGENAALLSTLLLLQAEALDLSGRPEEARVVRVDSLGWARYGFGPDWAVRAKQREIASLNPRK